MISERRATWTPVKMTGGYVTNPSAAQRFQTSSSGDATRGAFAPWLVSLVDGIAGVGGIRKVFIISLSGFLMFSCLSLFLPLYTTSPHTHFPDGRTERTDGRMGQNTRNTYLYLDGGHPPNGFQHQETLSFHDTPIPIHTYMYSYFFPSLPDVLCVINQTLS